MGRVKAINSLRCGVSLALEQDIDLAAEELVVDIVLPGGSLSDADLQIQMLLQQRNQLLNIAARFAGIVKLLDAG